MTQNRSPACSVCCWLLGAMLLLSVGCAPGPHVKGRWHGTLVEVPVYRGDRELLALGLRVEGGTDVSKMPFSARHQLEIGSPVILGWYEDGNPTFVPAAECRNIGRQATVEGVLMDRGLSSPRRLEGGGGGVLDESGNHRHLILFIRPRDMDRLNR